MRKHGKKDANQKEIEDALRAVGAKVQDTSEMGDGCPDMFVAFRGEWYVAEIKDGSKPMSAQKLTFEEDYWHGEFGQQAKVWVWRSVDDALIAIGAVAGVRV